MLCSYRLCLFVVFYVPCSMLWCQPTVWEYPKHRIHLKYIYYNIWIWLVLESELEFEFESECGFSDCGQDCYQCNRKVEIIYRPRQIPFASNICMYLYSGSIRKHSAYGSSVTVFLLKSNLNNRRFLFRSICFLLHHSFSVFYLIFFHLIRCSIIMPKCLLLMCCCFSFFFLCKKI